MTQRKLERFGDLVREEGLADAGSATTSYASHKLRRLASTALLYVLYHPASVPDRRRTIRVSPSHVQYVIWTSDLNAYFDHEVPYHTPVWDGDWDRLKIPFVETELHRSFQDHFEDGVPWVQTDYYRYQEADGRPQPLAFLENYDRLYEDMANHGFRDGEKIDVFVGREGEYIRHNGAHRLSIAKILDLDTIAVRVRARHRTWQRVRDRYARYRVLEYSGDAHHPDLIDMLD